MKKSIIIIAIIVVTIILLSYYLFFVDTDKKESEPTEGGSGSFGPPRSQPSGSPLEDIGAVLPIKDKNIGKYAFANQNNVKIMKKDFKTVYKTVQKNDFIGAITGEKYTNWFEINTTSGDGYVLKGSVNVKDSIN